MNCSAHEKNRTWSLFRGRLLPWKTGVSQCTTGRNFRNTEWLKCIPTGRLFQFLPTGRHFHFYLQQGGTPSGRVEREHWREMGRCEYRGARACSSVDRKPCHVEMVRLISPLNVFGELNIGNIDGFPTQPNPSFRFVGGTSCGWTKALQCGFPTSPANNLNLRSTPGPGCSSAGSSALSRLTQPLRVGLSLARLLRAPTSTGSLERSLIPKVAEWSGWWRWC